MPRGATSSASTSVLPSRANFVEASIPHPAALAKPPTELMLITWPACSRMTGRSARWTARTPKTSVSYMARTAVSSASSTAVSMPWPALFDQDVDPAEAVHGGRHGGPDPVRVGDVQIDGQQRLAGVRELPGDGVRAAGGAHDLVAFGQGGTHDLRAEPTGRSRDEPHTHCCTSFAAACLPPPARAGRGPVLRRTGRETALRPAAAARTGRHLQLTADPAFLPTRDGWDGGNRRTARTGWP